MSALIFGVANKWSLAWSIARGWDAAGTPVIMVCRSERERASVDNLAQTLKHNKQLQAPVLTCDATDDKQLAMVFEQANESFQGELNSVLHGIAAAPPRCIGQTVPSIDGQGILVHPRSKYLFVVGHCQACHSFDGTALLNAFLLAIQSVQCNHQISVHHHSLLHWC